MDTLTAIRNKEVALPVPIQIMFGGCSVDPELIEVYNQQPRWDEPEVDAILVAPYSSL